MRTNPLIGIILLLIIVLGVLAWFFFGQPVFAPTVDNATTTTGGQVNTGTDTTPSTADQLKARVVIDAPESGGAVPKNFTVTGKAPGLWYFEASFPIEVRSATGTVLVSTHATALTDWMTTSDVAFKAEISVPNYKGAATLVLMRDNPSGLPENDASVSIPITIN